MATCVVKLLFLTAFAMRLRCTFADSETKISQSNGTQEQTILRSDITENVSLVDHEAEEIEDEEERKRRDAWRTHMRYISSNVTKVLRSGDPSTLARFNISHCDFGISTSFVVCEFIGEALDFRPFKRYDFHLHFAITFRTIADNCVNIINNVQTENNGTTSATAETNTETSEQGLTHEAHCLLKLWEVRMTKVDGDNKRKYLSSGPLGPDFFLFLSLGLERLQWEMDFASEVAVGVLFLSSACPNMNRNQSTCVQRVEFINFPGIFEFYGKRQITYDEVFWDAFRSIAVDILGGHNASLNMLCMSDIDIDRYIAPFLNGTELSSLSITGHKNWTTVKGIMENLPHLKYLDLSNNNLMYIDTSNFQEAPNIEDLSLSSTKIQMIPEGISLLPNLKHLDLSGNILNYSQLQFSNILHNLTNLTWLSFSHTNLKSLEYLHHLILGGNNSVSHIRLQHLDISNCGISDLSDGKIFREQLSLRNINLSGNNMKLIPPKLFVGFPELRCINLSHLNLREGPKLELGLKKVLQYIDLSYNKLRYPGDILSSGTVSELDLSHNFIKSWSDPFVFAKHDISSKYNEFTTMHHTWVDNLNLSYNLMPTITKTMGASMKPLASVDLGENPFQCMDCHVEEFKIWYQNLKKESRVVEILLLREKGIPMCTRSDNLSLHTILDAYMPDTCFNRVINYWVVAGSTAGSFLVLGVVLYLLHRRYKFEIAYVMFLLKEKKTRDSVEHTEDFEYDAFVSYRRESYILGGKSPADDLQRVHSFRESQKCSVA
ncbi:uncharacterized protein [Periplaneta americana]|uniref:uncharacterized protein isoform X2 n=1 Tax=Periplaneta americana TaxID=6978 RepID=UPI0037E9ADAE